MARIKSSLFLGLLIFVSLGTLYVYTTRNENTSLSRIQELLTSIKGAYQFHKVSITSTKPYYSNSSLLIQQDKWLTKDCIGGHIANLAPICGTGGCLQVKYMSL